MQVNIDKVIFGEKINSYKNGKNTVIEHLSNNGITVRRIEYDEFNRDIDSIIFNTQGEVLEHLHKDYYISENEEGIIESYKSLTQEYRRKSYTKIENNFKHFIDDFQSKTGNSYINEFIHDFTGKLVRIINNGKIINL